MINIFKTIKKKIAEKKARYNYLKMKEFKTILEYQEYVSLQRQLFLINLLKRKKS